MTDIIDDFRTRVSQNNSYTDGLSSFMFNLENDFISSLNSDPSAVNISIYSMENQFESDDKKYRNARVIINEIATNDQKSFDEKYVLSKKEDDIKYGMYIKFKDWFWIVDFQEYQTHDVYNKHVIRRCNKLLKYNVGNKKYYEIPVVAKNLTQYSDGMQDVKYTSISDNRVSCLFGVNSVTTEIDLGQRFILNKNSYRVTFLEDYQFSEGYSGDIGLGNMIMIYDPSHDTDDFDLGVDTVKDKNVNLSGIDGSYKLIPSGDFIYKYTGTYQFGTYWEVSYKDKKDFVTITDLGNTGEIKCKLTILDDLDLIGENVTLELHDNTGTIISKYELLVSVF